MAEEDVLLKSEFVLHKLKRRRFPQQGCAPELRTDPSVWARLMFAIMLIFALVLQPIASGSVASAQDVADGDLMLIKADLVYLGDDSQPGPAMVLVQAGKIKAIGAKIEVPEGTQTVEVAALMPGMVDAVSNVGIVGGDAEVTNEVTPDFETLASVDFEDISFRKAADGGMTTLNIVPGTDNVVAGYAGVLKSAGKDREKRTVRLHSGMVLSMCSDPAARNNSRSRPDSIYVRQPTNRMGVVWILRSRFHAARLWQQQPDRASQYPVSDRLLAGLFKGDDVVMGVSRLAFDIHTLTEIANEFGFKPILIGGDEAYKTIDLLVEKKMSVVFTASSTSERGAEGSELAWGTPAKLADAKIPFCLAGDNLLAQARFGVRFGLTPNQALAAVTSSPAEILGLGDRLGSIKVGYDADLVALSGDPLQFTSSIQWTMVDGKLLSNEEGNNE